MQQSVYHGNNDDLLIEAYNNRSIDLSRECDV